MLNKCKKCKRGFECDHEFNKGDYSFKHCVKCGAGRENGDKCQGICPDCKKDIL